MSVSAASSPKRSWRWIIACGSAALLALLLLYIAGRPESRGPDLMSIATRITSVQEGVYSCSWLSDHELLVKTWRTYPNRLYPFPLTLELIDTRTNARTQLSALTDAINRACDHTPPSPYNFVMTPDKRYLRWEVRSPLDGGTRNATAHLDGSNYHRWGVLEEQKQDEWWLPGARWVTILKHKNSRFITLSDPDHPGNQKLFPLNSEQGKRLAALRNQAVADKYTWNLSCDPTTLIVWERLGGSKTSKLQELDHLHFPRQIIMESDFPNPQSDRIVLNFDEDQAPPLGAFLHRMFPAYKVTPKPVNRLLVYKKDNKSLTEIGRLPGLPLGQMGQLQGMQWLDDGRHLSFVYRGSVYVVPTP